MRCLPNCRCRLSATPVATSSAAHAQTTTPKLACAIFIIRAGRGTPEACHTRVSFQYFDAAPQRSGRTHDARGSSSQIQGPPLSSIVTYLRSVPAPRHRARLRHDPRHHLPSGVILEPDTHGSDGGWWLVASCFAVGCFCLGEERYTERERKRCKRIKKIIMK